MMPKLHELEQKLASLPADEQAVWIERFLAELQRHTAPERSERELPGVWIAGDAPDSVAVAAAIEQLEQFARGKTLGKDLRLRDLIDEGRRY